MADENKRAEADASERSERKGSSGSLRNKPAPNKNRKFGNRPNRRNNPGRQENVGDDPVAEQNPDAFQEYKQSMAEIEIPAAENDVDMKEEGFEIALEARRNQMIHVKNLEENQTVYQAISFNVTSIEAKDAEEVKANIDAFVAKNGDLKSKLVIAREKIKNAKRLLGEVEISARRIDDARDDSANSEQMKLLRRGILAGDGLKNFDDSLTDMVDKSDETNNLADNAREKEIITEGIVAYIDSASLAPFGDAIKAKAEALKVDVDANMAEALTDVEAAKVLLRTRIAELATAAASKDRSELFLDSLNDTLDYIDDVVPPEEDIQEILSQVERTFETQENDDDEG